MVNFKKGSNMIINKQRLRNTRIYNWIVDFCNTNIVAKIIVLVLIWVVVSIPMDFYLLIRWMIGPEGFWQELALIVAGAIAIGWLQGILMFFGIILSIAVITEEF
jgi:hypothetical protein